MLIVVRDICWSESGVYADRDSLLIETNVISPHGAIPHLIYTENPRFLIRKVDRIIQKNGYATMFMHGHWPHLPPWAASVLTRRDGSLRGIRISSTRFSNVRCFLFYKNRNEVSALPWRDSFCHPKRTFSIELGMRSLRCLAGAVFVTKTALSL